MPRNSTAMVTCFRRGGQELEQAPGDRVVLAEAGAVEVRAGETAGTGRPRHGRAEQEQFRVDRSVGADRAAVAVGLELAAAEARTVSGDQLVRREQAVVQQAF